MHIRASELHLSHSVWCVVVNNGGKKLMHQQNTKTPKGSPKEQKEWSAENKLNNLEYHNR